MGCVYQRKNKFKSVIYGGKFFNIKTTPRPFTSFLNAPSSSPSSLSLCNIHSVLLLSTIFMFWSAGSTVLDTINFRRDLGIITARLPTSFSISPRPLFHFASLNFYNKCIGLGRVVVALRTVVFFVSPLQDLVLIISCNFSCFFTRELLSESSIVFSCAHHLWMDFKVR